MGWLDELSNWLDAAEGSEPDEAPPPPPPNFTVGPRPFGISREVAGVEWQTDQRTSGVVRYRPLGSEAWAEVIDDSRQRDHQRTLTPLTPDTEYEVEVTAVVPKRGTPRTTQALTLRTSVVPRPEAPPPPPPPPPPPLPGGGIYRATKLVGYGLVNRWHMADADQHAEALHRAGLTLTQIELIPWWGPTSTSQAYNDGGRFTWTDIGRARAFLDAHRRRGIATLITLVNWNAAAERSESDAWFVSLVQQVRDQMGTDLVLLEGVSEGDNSAKARQWDRLLEQHWSGRIVKNGGGGRGDVSGRYELNDWHHCSDWNASTLKGAPYLNSTDCGPVINPGPQRAAAMLRAALDLGGHAIIYDFMGTQIDFATIAAMGAEVQRGTGHVQATEPSPTQPDPPPPPPPPPEPSDDSIPHPAATVNLLVDHRVWSAGTLTQVDPVFSSWLRRYCLGGPTKLVLADLARVPERLRGAGFRGRDNALWYTLSRSYAEWNWQFNPNDPDHHLSNQRGELHDFWENYVDVVASVLAAAPQTTALILLNDEVDRCGKTLGEYTQRQLNAFRARVELGHFVQD